MTAKERWKRFDENIASLTIALCTVIIIYVIVSIFLDLRNKPGQPLRPTWKEFISDIRDLLPIE